MAQFDIHKNPSAAARRHVPFIVNLQSDHLEHLATRLCAPIKNRKTSSMPINDLMPELEIDGQRFVIFMQETAAVPASMLGASVGTASEIRFQFVAAIDLLISGI
jgi:toxin CcdB